MGNITRRNALAVTGAGLAASLSTVAAQAAAIPMAVADVETPTSLARRLALALADDSGMAGQFVAIVHPAATKEHPIAFNDRKMHEEMAQLANRAMWKADADKDLITLGAELDRELTAHAALAKEFARLHKLCEQRVPCGVTPWDKEHKDAWKAADRALGLGKAGRAMSRVRRRLDKLARRIKEMPAATVAGFAVKATALFWETVFWERDNPEDPNITAFRKFIAAMRSAGNAS